MDSRPAKRARQACEPCRRKKSRCPGEKPICSFCSRLKQPCKYSDDWEGSAYPKSGNPEQTGSMWEERFETLEAKVDLVLNTVLSTQSREPPNTSISSQTIPSLHNSTVPKVQRNDSLETISLPPHVIIGLLETYIRRCDCQPLSIFDVDDLRQNFGSCKPEVLFSILALSLRFSESSQLLGETAQLALQYTNATRKIIMGKIVEGDVEMTTLQALCLHAFFDIITGNVQRAWLSIGIGMRLVISIPKPPSPEGNIDQLELNEYRRCFWGFYMLECLCSDASAGRLALPHEKPPFPPSLSVRSEHGGRAILPKFGDCHSGQTQDKGIIGYSFQLVELWKNALQYVIKSLESTEVPWSPGSGYFDMSSSIMEWETYLCRNHRSAHAMFSEQSPTDLQMNTRYWGPWLNVQFTYHGTLCILNNPFYLFQKVKSNAGISSTSFMETASDMALLHAKHIARLIETLGDRQFEPSDPFLGYCAAIACLSHLRYCHVEDRGVKEQAQARFATCYNFVLRLASKWPNVQVIANNLLNVSKKALAWKFSQSHPFTILEIPSSDLSLIWDLLSYPVQSKSRETGKSIFAPSLALGAVEKEPSNIKLSQTPGNTRDLTMSVPNFSRYPTPVSLELQESREQSIQAGTLDNLGWELFNESFISEGQPFEDDMSNWWTVGNL